MTAIAKNTATTGSGFRMIYYLLIAVGSIVLTLALMALSFGNGQATENAVSIPLVLHLATVVPALPLGAYVLFTKKGGPRHMLLGRIWVMLMVTTSITTFWFSLSFIHAFSVLVLVSTPIAIWRIRVGDVEGHRKAMEGMYIGLIIAGAFSFLPGRFMGTMLLG